MCIWIIGFRLKVIDCNYRLEIIGYRLKVIGCRLGYEHEDPMCGSKAQQKREFQKAWFVGS